jgi:hypothetical protein
MVLDSEHAAAVAATAVVVVAVAVVVAVVVVVLEVLDVVVVLDAAHLPLQPLALALVDYRLLAALVHLTFHGRFQCRLWARQALHLVLARFEFFLDAMNPNFPKKNK